VVLVASLKRDPGPEPFGRQPSEPSLVSVRENDEWQDFEIDHIVARRTSWVAKKLVLEYLVRYVEYGAHSSQPSVC
jgi:hypothetical protein